MMHRWRWRTAFVVGVGTLCAAVAAGPAGAEAPAEQRSDKGWAVLRLEAGYLVYNNVWNKEGARGPHGQAVFARQADGAAAFGWQWKWPAADGVVAYPEVIFGDTPWDRFPRRQVGELPFLAGSRGMTVDYDISLQTGGMCNMAFEFWTVSSLPASSDKITHEVMIWIDNHDMTPAGSWTDKLVTGDLTWDMFLRQGHGDLSGRNPQKWTYIAFLARKPVLKGPLDIGAFVRFLQEKDLLGKDVYITSLELGNEIITGAGSAEVRNYRVTIK